MNNILAYIQMIREKSGDNGDWTYALGCDLPDIWEDNFNAECGNENKEECHSVTVNGVKTKRCWKCCNGPLCNDYLSGSAIMSIGLTVMLTCAIFNILSW